MASARPLFVNEIDNGNFIDIDQHIIDSNSGGVIIYIPRGEGKKEGQRMSRQQFGRDDNRIPPIKEQICSHEQMKAMSMERNYQHEMANQNKSSASNMSFHDAVSSSPPAYSRTQDDMFMRYREGHACCNYMSGDYLNEDVDKNTPKAGEIRATCQILPRQFNYNVYPDERTDSPQILRVSVDTSSMRNLPPHSTMDITVELPPCFHDLLYVSCDSTITVNRMPSPVPSQMNSPASSPVSSSPTSLRQKRRDCRCRNSPDISFDSTSAGRQASFLQVPEMRPRSNSDSKLEVKPQRRKKSSNRSATENLIKASAIHLPEIKVYDFSDRRRYLKKCLQNESEELQKDLGNNAEFFSELNSHRKRSNTCPAQTLNRVRRKLPTPVSRPNNDRGQTPNNAPCKPSKSFVPNNLYKVPENCSLNEDDKHHKYQRAYPEN